MSSSVWSSNLNVGESPNLSKENCMEPYLPGGMASQDLYPTTQTSMISYSPCFIVTWVMGV